jgi:myo-inositol-1(or 4)-monophosphatase
VGNLTGEADFLDQKECLAGAPRIYGQLVNILGKYSKFASAGEKAGVNDAVAKLDADMRPAAHDAPVAPSEDAPF